VSFVLRRSDLEYTYDSLDPSTITLEGEIENESVFKEAFSDYERDEDGVVIAKVPGASGFFAQGDTFEEARTKLQDVIEGNVILALQLGFEIPEII